MLFPYILIRKKKAVHKTTSTDDKRLQSTLKRIGVNTIPSIEEVNIFRDDSVIQFANPKGKIRNHIFSGMHLHKFSLWWLNLFVFPSVQASIVANTWVVSGSPQTKSTLFSCSYIQSEWESISNNWLWKGNWFYSEIWFFAAVRAFSLSLNIFESFSDCWWKRLTRFCDCLGNFMFVLSWNFKWLCNWIYYLN